MILYLNHPNHTVFHSHVSETHNIVQQIASTQQYATESYRLSILTYNVWRPYPLDGIPLNVDIKTINSNQRWDRIQYPRKNALLSFFNQYTKFVDIFFLQETTKQVIDTFQKESKWTNHFDFMHASISDDIEEDQHISTALFWNKYLFNKLDGNVLKINGASMTWIKLQYKHKNGLLSDIPIICISLHLTYQGRVNETESGYNPRIEQMKAILNYIENEIKEQYKYEHEIVFICGDLNDHFHPIGIAKQNGYHHAFYDLGRVFPKTFPTPAASVAHIGPDLQSEVTYDWIMVQNDNKLQVKCMMADVLEYNKNGIYPSDHYPVMAIYQITQ